jgi:DNA polymerase III delta prime subunit
MAFSSVIVRKCRERLGTLFSGEPGHAYLITGPSGIGKTLIARETAKALLCSRPSSDGSCGCVRLAVRRSGIASGISRTHTGIRRKEHQSCGCKEPDLCGRKYFSAVFLKERYI